MVRVPEPTQEPGTRGGRKIPLESKPQLPSVRGDRLVARTGGGGGYDPPGERDANLAERDRLDGFASNPGQAAPRGQEVP